MSHFKWVKKTIDWHCNVCLEENYAVDLSHDSATNVIIDDFISSKNLKSDSMADPLRETGEDSSLPFFQLVYTFMINFIIHTKKSW